MSSLDQLLETAVAGHDIPGAVMLARNKSGTFNFNKSIGLLSPEAGPDSTAYSPSSLLEMASMTKFITAIAALQVVERGLVTLDQDLAQGDILPASFCALDILTGFDDDDDDSNNNQPQLRKRTKAITLRQLLTHSAGAGYAFRDPLLERYRTQVQGRTTTDGDKVDKRFDYPLIYEPGEGWAYGSSVDRAGQVVERVSGLELGEYMRRHIFEPLGMRSATFRPSEDRQDKAAVTFRDPETGRAVEAKPGQPTLVSGTTEAFGGQGLYMTAEDYFAVLSSLLLDDGKLLGSETRELMFQPQLSPASKAALLRNLETPSWAVGDFPVTGEYDWGLSGLLVDGDSHEFRRKGALMWGGAANLTWFIDREAGVTGTFATQVYPAGDEKTRVLYSAFEREVYRLGASPKQ